MRKREAQSFYDDFSICPHHTQHPPSSESQPSSSKAKTQPSCSEAETQLSDFFKSPAHASGAWRHSHPAVTFSIWGFYCDISEWHVRSAHAWTPVLMLHLTNPCAKRKVLSLTKPKGKIYKTKSLGHYITTLKLVIKKLNYLQNLNNWNIWLFSFTFWSDGETPVLELSEMSLLLCPLVFIRSLQKKLLLDQSFETF